jgi:hypothetical protein
MMGPARDVIACLAVGRYHIVLLIVVHGCQEQQTLHGSDGGWLNDVSLIAPPSS